MNPTTKRIVTGYNKFILDKLGIVNNAVAQFALVRLSNIYKGPCLRVVNSSTLAELDIGFTPDGNLNTTTLLTFIGSNDALVTKWYNQYSLGNDAIQTNMSYMPKIVVSGIIETNGILFDGIDDFLLADNYTAVPYNTTFTLYNNFYSTLNITQYIFSKNTDTINDTFANIFVLGSRLYFKTADHNLINTNGGLGGHTCICTYLPTGDKKANYDGNEVSTNVAVSPINGTRINISGIYSGGSQATHFEGNIKSALIFNSDEYSNYNNLVAGGV